MTESRRTNGLVCSGILLVGLYMHQLTIWFYSGAWYLAFPSAAIMLWGVVAFSELLEAAKK